MTDALLRYEKFGEEEWGQIDQNISQTDEKVCKAMVELGKAVDLEALDQKIFELPYLIVGEEIYLAKIRPILVQNKQLLKKKEKDVQKQEKTKEKSKKKGLKKEQGNNKVKEMEIQIVFQRIEKELNQVISNFENEKNNYNVGFYSITQLLEIKLIALIYNANYFKENTQNNIPECYEIVIGIIKIMSLLEHLNGPSILNQNHEIKFSKSMFDDLRTVLTALAAKIQFSIEFMFKNFPKLIISTKFDSYFPGLDIKPYPSQIQLIEKLKQGLREQKPTMIFYRAMIGSGKTSSSISLASLAANNSQELTIVYCCALKNVRHQVGRMLAQGTDLKFALLSLWDVDIELDPKNFQGNSKKLEKRKADLQDALQFQEQIRAKEGPDALVARQINHNSCKNDEDVNLLVSDIASTEFLLKNQKVIYRSKKNTPYQILTKKLENIILFIDEPTISQLINDKVVQLMEYCPKYVILSSATLPHNDKIKKFINLFRQKDKQSLLASVDSVDSNIGTQLMSFDYQKRIPHFGFKSKEEILFLARKISVNGFLARLYNGVNLFELYNIMKKYDIDIKESLEDYFLEPSHLSQSNIQKKTIELLQILANYPDKIEKICDPNEYMTNLTEIEKEEMNITNKAGKNQFLELDNYLLLTYQAHKFMGGCLIGTINPLEYAEQNFVFYTEDIKPIYKYEKKLEKDLEKYEKEIEILRDQIKNEEELFRKIDEKQQHKPQVKFPSEKRINSIPHLKKYFSKNVEKKILSHVQKEVYFEEIPKNSNVPDWILQLLLCGVGIYQSDSSVLDKAYLDCVMDLASKRKLAYLISNKELSYGTNIPVNHVVIYDDLGKDLGLGSIFQYIGRAGRVGQSWSAYGHIDNLTLNNINSFIKSPDYYADFEETNFIQSSLQKLTCFNDLKEEIFEDINTFYGVALKQGSLTSFLASINVSFHVMNLLQNINPDYRQKEFGEFAKFYVISIKKNFKNQYYKPNMKFQEFFWLADTNKADISNVLQYVNKMLHVFCYTQAQVDDIKELKNEKVTIIKINNSQQYALEIFQFIKKINPTFLNFTLPEEFKNSDKIFVKEEYIVANYQSSEQTYFSQKNSDSERYKSLQFFYNTLDFDKETIDLSCFLRFASLQQDLVSKIVQIQIPALLHKSLELLKENVYICIFDKDSIESYIGLNKEKLVKALKNKACKKISSVLYIERNPNDEFTKLEPFLIQALFEKSIGMGITQNLILVKGYFSLRYLGQISVKAFIGEPECSIMKQLRKHSKEVNIESETYFEGIVDGSIISKCQLESPLPQIISLKQLSLPLLIKHLAKF